ncbi:methyltransferase [Candidatus Falkowbacteria bacterium]|jgi:release factor glutamine methyltransferase|nr:methyltransferase [Candidatus Falkowbacteria bacterium]MBT4433319.1 methyltransferase [Candidatus Falkowbacteria bacterium]
MNLIVKDIDRVKNTLEKLHKSKKLFFALFFDERPVHKKYFSDDQISILKATNLISIKQNYISANYRVIKLQNNNNSAFIVTDKVSYKKLDQVMPLHPENQFIVDDMKIKADDEVLEIGVGSGVNVIFSIMSGAKKVTALDINKRTFEFTKFNAALNLSKQDQNKINLILNKKSSLENIFDSVKNKKFDYIVTNPPFEPTPPKSKYLLNSASGIYGLDVIEAILKKTKQHLKNAGYLQMVTFSPGNQKEPFMLKEMLNKYLGAGIIHLNKIGMKYVDFTKRFIDLGYDKEKVDLMNLQAKKDKVTHLYLSMVQYNNQMEDVKIKTSTKIYKNWDIPIYSDVPMGFKPKKSKLKLD